MLSNRIRHALELDTRIAIWQFQKRLSWSRYLSILLVSVPVTPVAPVIRAEGHNQLRSCHPPHGDGSCCSSSGRAEERYDACNAVESSLEVDGYAAVFIIRTHGPTFKPGCSVALLPSNPGDQLVLWGYRHPTPSSVKVWALTVRITHSCALPQMMFIPNVSTSMAESTPELIFRCTVCG